MQVAAKLAAELQRRALLPRASAQPEAFLSPTTEASAASSVAPSERGRAAAAGDPQAGTTELEVEPDVPVVLTESEVASASQDAQVCTRSSFGASGFMLLAQHYCTLVCSHFKVGFSCALQPQSMYLLHGCKFDFIDCLIALLSLIGEFDGSWMLGNSSDVQATRD